MTNESRHAITEVGDCAPWCEACRREQTERDRSAKSDSIKWVYISGPYTKGDVAQNVRNAIEAGLEVRKAGHVPIIPHLSHFIHIIWPKDYRYWMEWDLDLIKRCDALIRLPGESAGADEEVEFALERAIPVYYWVKEFIGAEALQ